jgi:hypothetical protein
MNRNTRFIAPYGVQHGPRRFYRAMIDGAFVDDDEYGRLFRLFEAARTEDRKRKAAARKAAREQAKGAA